MISVAGRPIVLVASPVQTHSGLWDAAQLDMAVLVTPNIIGNASPRQFCLHQLCTMSTLSVEDKATVPLVLHAQIVDGLVEDAHLGLSA